MGAGANEVMASIAVRISGDEIRVLRQLAGEVEKRLSRCEHKWGQRLMQIQITLLIVLTSE